MSKKKERLLKKKNKKIESGIVLPVEGGGLSLPQETILVLQQKAISAGEKCHLVYTVGKEGFEGFNVGTTDQIGRLFMPTLSEQRQIDEEKKDRHHKRLRENFSVIIERIVKAFKHPLGG